MSLESRQFDIVEIVGADPLEILAAEKAVTREAISGFTVFPEIEDEGLQYGTLEEILSKSQSVSSRRPGEVNF